MGEKSELSMSVQSAWEDLIVENPNRRKLEACLVTTIMIVVVCIMGLLLFVVIELQPANNLKRVSRRPNVEDCSNGTCPEFGHRVLGWLNFRGKPCINFHDYVCNSRLTDSPEDAFRQTAERAGTHTANAEFYKLFMRNYKYELTKANVNEIAVKYIAALYDVCMNGVGKTAENVHKLIPFLDQTLWNGAVKGLAGADQASAFEEYHVKLMQDFNFHPFGRMLKQDDNWIVMPMSLLGTSEQLELGGFQKEMADAFGAFLVHYKKGNSDDAKNAPEIEAKIAKAMVAKDVDADFPSNKVLGGFKGGPNLDLFGLVKKVFGDDYTGKFLGRHPTTGPALEVYNQGGAKSMNLATFKFLLKLSLFMDEDEPALAPFFQFANKYHWGSKVLPVKVYRCGSFIENYLKPAMMHFISVYDKDRLEALKNQTMTTLKDFTSFDPADKKAVSPLMAGLKNAKSKYSELGGDLMLLEMFYFQDTKKYSDDYFTCGSKTLADWDPAAPGGFLQHVAELGALFSCNYAKPDFRQLHGMPVLGSEPYYDFVSGKTFVPYGFSFPPNYHPFVRGISFHHYAPGYYFRLIGETVKAAIYRNASVGTSKGPWKAESVEVESAIKCYQKQIKTKQNVTGAVQIFADSFALPFAYNLYRTTLNHASWDVKKQARVALIPMFTEGQFFFIQAAQTRCEYMYMDPKIEYPKKMSGASPEERINLVFAQSNQLFADRFGCGKGRPMATLVDCKLPVLLLKKGTEKDYPGVYI